jgi:Fe-S oxidoreductase
MDQHRRIPEFAPVTLQNWFRSRGGSANKTGSAVILWPDTFNNYFHTQVGISAVESLESAGYRVLMPRQHVCCGRPLYDYGFLDMAERYLHRTLSVLRPGIRDGTPVVGMEPSCLAVFRDELPKMLPNNEDAKRLRKCSYHWPEFFEQHKIPLPKLDAKALVWGHCHHKATGGMESEMKLLKAQMGLDAEESTGGCCGLAGSWGFESGKYDISMQCGEIGWLPAVRNAAPSTLIIADGFSCQTQLQESSIGREALHIAEVMNVASRLSSPRMHGAYPERLRRPKPQARRVLRIVRVTIAVGLLTLGASAVTLGIRKMLRML